MIYAIDHMFIAERASGNDFIKGTQYKVYHIKSIEEDKIKKFRYTFIDSSGKSVYVSFLSPYDADSFIARISGKVDVLEKERAKVKSIQEADAF